MENLFEQNYYDLLDITPTSSTEQIRKAYLLACQTYNSNSMAVYSLFDEGETKQILDKIEKAYHVLINPESRRKYDETLTEKGVLKFETPFSPFKEQELADPPHDQKAPEKFREPQKKAAPAPAPTNVKTEEEKQKLKQNIVKQIISNTDTFNGRIFKDTRTLLGYSLEDVSRVTKIRVTYLQGIEDEIVNQLPARIYIRGFVENYCSFLGLPVKKATEDYMSRILL